MIEYRQLYGEFDGILQSCCKNQLKGDIEMFKDTTLCMGCMCDKTYDGPCKLCGYSDDAPCIPSYLVPKTFLNERYIVGKVLSYNGEGAVYIGYDTATGTKVDIKEFMPDTLCSRKRGEAEITVNSDVMPLYKTYMLEFIDLNKTLMKSRGMAHLQMVLDIFTENGTAYAVYEHINGIPLSAYLANTGREMSWEQVKQLFPPILTTLSLVHAAGIIHRGISPSTIFVTDKMELKLSGFAISAARTTNTEIACEMFAGFAAPEQYVSNEANGTWTDVYGISAVLYRVLTTFTPQEAIARTGGSMLEPMMIDRDVPANVSKVIMQGMRLSTDSRIKTITEFVDMLFSAPAKQDIYDSAKPLTRQQAKKLKKQKKERAKTIAVLACAAVVMIAFVIVFIWAAGNTGSESSSGNSESSVSESQESVVTSSTAGSTTSAAEENPPEEQVSVPDANISLPNFVTRRYESAVNQYMNIFTFKIEASEYNDDYPDGIIFEQDIEAGTMVAEGTVITVKVSKGPGIVELPDYAGLSVTDYIAKLSELNIKYKIESKKTNDAKDGQIAGCSKEVGDPVSVETSEEIVVYIAENYEEETSASEQESESSEAPQETSEQNEEQQED